MKKHFLSFLAFLLCLTRLHAQNAPSIEWQKCFGGTDYEWEPAIQQTPDHGFIIAGQSNSNDGDVSGNHGGMDYWIIRLDSMGNIQWEKSLGGSHGDWAYAIDQTFDGGLILAGESDSENGDVSWNHGEGDCWIVKLDSSENIQWQKSLGGSDLDYAHDIQETYDGGFIVAASSYSNNGEVSGNHGDNDYWIVKLDSSGNIQWQKSLGGSNREIPFSIQQIVDSGFIVAGYSESDDGDVSGNHGFQDCWIVKLDNSGNIQWQKSLGGSGADWARSILQTPDYGFIVAGLSNSNDGDVSGNHGNKDYWIAKLDLLGNIQWQQSLGGSYEDDGTSVQKTNDGGFIVAGISLSNNGDVSGHHGSIYYSDYWIIKLNSFGNIQWQKSLGGSGDDIAWSTQSIQQTADEGFIVAGKSSSNSGNVSGNHGLEDYWIVKLSPEIPLGFSSSEHAGIFSVYPNPANSNITITATFSSPQSLMIKLTDIIGREVLLFDEGMVSGNFTAQHDLSALSSGTYFLKMIHDGTSEVLKLQIEK